MRPLLIVLGWLAGALVASGCTGGDGGGPAFPPFDPFGSEPAPTTGTEPTSGGDEVPVGGTLEDLCARACAHIASSCPGSTTAGPDCAGECFSSSANVPSCADQFKAFVSCIATTPLACSPTGSGVSAPACDALVAALNSCGPQPGGGSV